MATVKVFDETMTGREIASFEMLVPETFTVAELVRLRVREEVARYNASLSGRFKGLVRPKDVSEDREGYKVQKGRRINWEEQAETALQALSRNGFVILVDDRQVEELDEVLDVEQFSKVAFVKLVPLVGG